MCIRLFLSTERESPREGGGDAKSASNLRAREKPGASESQLPPSVSPSKVKQADTEEAELQRNTKALKSSGEAEVPQQKKAAKSWTSPRRKGRAVEEAQPAKPPAADLWEKGKQAAGGRTKEDDVPPGGTQETSKEGPVDATGKRPAKSFAASWKQGKAASIPVKAAGDAQVDDLIDGGQHSAGQNRGEELNGRELSAEAQAMAGQTESNGTSQGRLPKSG
jgi:hypothetical protein